MGIDFIRLDLGLRDGTHFLRMGQFNRFNLLQILKKIVHHSPGPRSFQNRFAWTFQPWTAESYSNGVLGYEEGGGSVYPIIPEDSKKYLRDLEYYGGKGNVLADEFRRGFVGLWHVKSLAFTVGCIAILIFFGVFYAANHLPSRLKSDVPEESNRDETD
jgi:hypothetical protein